MDAQRAILAGNRLLSLDAFRGLTIAAMVLVNNPGSQDYVYPLLQHAEWHGWTLSDLISPFFIFGTNAIAVYAASSLVNKTLRWIMVFEGGEKISLYTYIYNHFLVPWAGHSLGSLMFPLFYILIWIGLFLPLYRKKIFIKV